MYIGDISNNRVRKVTVATNSPRYISHAYLTFHSLLFSFLTNLLLTSTTTSMSPTLVPPTSTPTTSTPSSNYPSLSPSIGIITTIAGTGSATYSGDSGQATAAGLYGPYDVDVDAAGE